MRSDTSLQPKLAFRADLHVHTTCSDGTLSPIQLVRLAVAVGLRGLSITDHDTIEAYDTAISEAAATGLELLSGIELSTRDEKESVHVLGYGFDIWSATLRNFCEQRVAARHERNEQILLRLGKLGMLISQEEIEHEAGIVGKRVFGRPHIARVMVQKGYVVTMREAFDKWLGESCPAYVHGYEVGVQQAIELIQRAGGKAVIAHPHYLRHESTTRRLLKMNFNGIECYYPHTKKGIERFWLRCARQAGWLVTGGSDFHGENRSHVQLGACWVGEEAFRALQGRS